MFSDPSPFVIVLMAFAAVTGVVFVAGQYLARELRIKQRIASPRAEQDSAETLVAGVNALVTRYFDEKKFKVEGPVRTKLRLTLMRAGFFHPNAINYYIFWRIALVIILPIFSYVVMVIFFPDARTVIKIGLLLLLTALAILGPDAYIARRQRKLAEDYATGFPDLLDLMVVCVDAGMGLEAALERISGEVIRRSRPLGMNLVLLGAETRAGKSTIDALDSFADRLGLDAARSFVAMLRQSIELGSDVGDGLRVFSEEMREKRLFRAEERANQLPVKMVLPLGVFIFPVILMLILLPVILRFVAVFR